MAAQKNVSSESEDDIPFKKADKDLLEGDENDEVDEDEEEYAVEKILSHKWVGKNKSKLQYKVKWVGYDETTEEPSENLDNCPDELDTYFKLIGGRPQLPNSPASSKKRPASEALSQVRGRPGVKKAKTEANNMVHSSTSNDSWKAPNGSWEDDVMAVDSMTRDENGENIAYLIWNNKHKSRHTTKLLNHKCPQKLLAFYEAHLFFSTVGIDEEDKAVKQIALDMSPAAKATKAGAVATQNGDADAEEDEEMEGIKAVASGS